MDNLGGFKRLFGVQPNTKVAVLVFGFFHGFGLATKLQDFELSSDGLVLNILAFNVGVEIGQLLALGAILIAMGFWRRSDAFARQRSEEHTSELQSLMRISYAVFCLKKKHTQTKA